MRSSYFISPKHPTKICDIASECVVQMYTNTQQIYYSDVFSFIQNRTLHVSGWVSANNHFSIDEIKIFILKNIETEIDIKINIEQIPFDNNIIKIERGTFLGYSTNENNEGIPFEHIEAKNLTKFLYEKINEGVLIQITINGEEIRVLLETNFKDTAYIKEITNEYFKNKYTKRTVNVNNIPNQIIFNSNNSFISNTYGPRTPYSNCKFVGLDIYRNVKYSHLLAKEIADYYISSRNLNYSLVELTYEQNNPNPIQFGIKGNKGGIHIENGTFFELLSTSPLLTKNLKIEELIKSKNNTLIEMSKWGYFNYR